MGRHPDPDSQLQKELTIGYLWPHHRSMARAMVAGGLQPGQLAKAFGFSEGQVTRIIHSPMFKAELARLEAEAEGIAVDIRADIKKSAEKAIEILDEQLHNEHHDAKLRQRAAFDILDRAGYGKQDRPIRAGGDINITQVNVKEMSTEKLRDGVMDLIEGQDYE